MDTSLMLPAQLFALSVFLILLLSAVVVLFFPRALVIWRTPVAESDGRQLFWLIIAIGLAVAQLLIFWFPHLIDMPDPVRLAFVFVPTMMFALAVLFSGQLLVLAALFVASFFGIVWGLGFDGIGSKVFSAAYVLSLVIEVLLVVRTLISERRDKG